MALLLGAALGKAAGGPTVLVDVQACLGVNADEVERLAALELRAYGVEEPTATTGTTRITVDCHNPLAELRVLDPVSGKRLTRTVDLTHVAAPARARVLALAIAELVGASWMELEYNPEPAVEPEESVAPPEARTAALRAARDRQRDAQSARATALLAHGSGRAFTSGLGPFLGGGVGVVHVDDRLALTFDLDIASRQGTVTGGDFRATAFSGAAGLGLRTAGTWSVAGVVGARAGGAWFDGDARAANLGGEQFQGAWFGPLFAGRLIGSTRGGVAFSPALELGYTAVGLAGLVRGERAVVLGGAWFAVTLGVGLAR